MSPFKGFPIRLPPSANANVLVSEPVLGYDSSQPPSDLAPGQSPSFENCILRQGGIEPRPCLTLRTVNPQPLGAIPISGGMEVLDTVGNRYPVVSGTTTWAWYSNGSWSVLSYVSSTGLSSPPAANSGDFYDFTQIYSDLRDEMFAVAAHDSYDTLLVWQANTATFSNLTGAPRATCVTAFDNYLVAGNIRSGASDYVQRLQWNDRGSASSWTGGTSGFVDMLDMRGRLQRLVPHDAGVAIFSDEETWMANRQVFPATFGVSAIDRGIGCPYRRTIVQTPLGIIFMSKDYQVYLLPHGGGAIRPVGQRLHRTIRDSIDQPKRAWATYDKTDGLYQFYYATRGGSGYPQKSVWLDVETGAWAPQTFDATGGGLSPSWGFDVTVTSTATIWTGWLVPWDNETLTWDELGGASEDRATLLGSSAGTLYYLNSNATSDNGVVVQNRWRSGALTADGADPDRMKNVTQVNVSYSATADSNLTLRLSADGGQTFNAGTRIAMGQTSIQSSVRVYVYENALLPTLEVTGEGRQGWKIFGFQAVMRQGGR